MTQALPWRVIVGSISCVFGVSNALADVQVAASLPMQWARISNASGNATLVSVLGAAAQVEWYFRDDVGVLASYEVNLTGRTVRMHGPGLGVGWTFWGTRALNESRGLLTARGTSPWAGRAEFHIHDRDYNFTDVESQDSTGIKSKTFSKGGFFAPTLGVGLEWQASPQVGLQARALASRALFLDAASLELDVFSLHVGIFLRR